MVLWGPTHRLTPKLVLCAHLNHPVTVDLDFYPIVKRDWTGMDWTWTCKTKTWKTMTCITWTRKTRTSKARTEKTRTFKTRTSKTRTCKARTWHAYYNSIIKMGVLIWSSFFSYMLLKLKSRMSLTGNTVTMATYDVMKMTILFNNDRAFVWYHQAPPPPPGVIDREFESNKRE